MLAGGVWQCRIKNRLRVLAWQRANPARANAKGNAWQKANPDKHADRQRRRRARKAAAISDGHSRKEVFDRDGGVCQLCFKPLDPLKWDEDHIIPIAHGGQDTMANCRATCISCNRSRGRKVYSDAIRLRVVAHEVWLP